jgi:aminopeptidase
MIDPRMETLAHKIVNYSTAVQKGEKVLIETTGYELPLTGRLVKEIYKAGGLPFITVKNDELSRVMINECTVEQMELLAGYELLRMKQMDVHIGILAGDNCHEFSDIPPEKLAIYHRHFRRPVHGEEKCNHTRWVLLRYPNRSMAQMAGMSTESFEDLYFKVCNLDYGRLSKAMESLVRMIERTSDVRITGPDTDLSFSLQGMPAIPLDGKSNIPDGEVYTAPVRHSVSGKIKFNIPSKYHEGMTHHGIYFEFRAGKIVQAASSSTAELNKLLDTDEGARYIGEFAFGLNPYLEHPMNDTLFDEKIKGSFHLTPGNSYRNCYNGNDSAIHWDIVSIQRPEYGGGEIWFDGVLIRKDGLFVHRELTCLNPDNLS